MFASNGLNAFELLLKRGGSSARNWGKVEASPLPRQLECSIAPEVDGGNRCEARTSGKSRLCLDIRRRESDNRGGRTQQQTSQLLDGVWVP